MKKLLVLPFLLIMQYAFSQSAPLPVDERGVHTFLQISEVSNPTMESMSARVINFFKNNSKVIKLRSSKGDSVFLGTGKMLLVKGAGGIGHPTAEVGYNISIQLKDDRYRLILTDFVVVPYERDRYANFVPATVKYRLEDKPGKLNRGEWEKNMKDIVRESVNLSEKLKIIMSTSPAELKVDDHKPGKISTIKW